MKNELAAECDKYLDIMKYHSVFCRESQFDTIYVKTTDNRRLREAAKVGEENLQRWLEDLNGVGRRTNFMRVISTSSVFDIINYTIVDKKSSKFCPPRS